MGDGTCFCRAQGATCDQTPYPGSLNWIVYNLQATPTTTISTNASAFDVVCTECGCSGTVDVDYKSFGVVVSATACYDAIVADPWCGTTFSMGDGTCFCRAPGATCDQTPYPGSTNWIVYNLQATP